MPGTGPRAKHWCFTLNNYTPADLDRLSSIGEEIVSYLVYGKEVGASGTPHLQGTVCFLSRKRLTQVIAIIGQAHCSVTRFLSQSIEYCKKDGDFFEIGNPPKGSGERSDLEDFKASVKEGVTDLEELRELHSSVCATYPRFVKEYINDKKEKFTVENHELRPWQSTLNSRLLRTPDKREIIFVIDLTGNKGKSWFARHYCDLHNNAQIIVPGKKADMSYVVRDDCRVFFLDCPRSKQGDFIQYDFLEELKNGYIFSPKYESTLKKFKTPHVVVLMNEHPDMSKLSEDRYSIVNLR
jgi:Putative viral replication protein